MNYNKNVVVFTLVFTFILLAYSLYAAIFNTHLLALDKISIVADVIKTTPKDTTKLQPVEAEATVNRVVTDTASHGPRDILKYLQTKTITSFYTDKAAAALPQTMHKLFAIKQGKKAKVRVAWLGDSFIEGDFLVKTFRRQIQQFVGGNGVGFVPVTSITNDGFRTTVSQKWEGDWNEENFKTKELSAPLFFSGRLYYSGNGSISLKDLTLGKDSGQVSEKSLLCGYSAAPVNLLVNGQPRQYAASRKLNRLLLDSSTGHNISVTIQNARLPVYGISMEPQSGVVVDNFSFRGISGEELGKLDTGFIRAIQEQNTYDLVILEYGVNVLYRPDNTDFAWHKRNMTRVLQKLHAAMPNTEFLVISTSDRGFRYGEESRTALGVDNLVKTQAELAYENGMAFFNMFASMGGAGTIVRWADSLPTLAGHDYVHPNGRGAELLGNMFFDCFLKDYEKANNPRVPQKDNIQPLKDGIPVAAANKPKSDTLPSPRKNSYVVTSCQSIIDKTTNLEWYVADDKDYTWQEANEWAKNLSVCNGNWRLPSVEELKTLYNASLTAGIGYLHTDGKLYQAKIDPAFSTIGHGAWVWSSIELGAEKAFSVNLNQGKGVASPKNKAAYPIRVFSVRKIDPSRVTH